MERIHTHFGSLGLTVLRTSALIAVAAIATAQTPAGPHNPAKGLHPVGVQPAPSPSPAPIPFCFGDAVSLACPCDNVGAPGHGCQNSAFTGGAILWASGASRIVSDTLQLDVRGTLPNSLSVLLQGDASVRPTAFGDGQRCVGGSLLRLYTQNAISGMVSFPSAGEPGIAARNDALGATLRNAAVRY